MSGEITPFEGGVSGTIQIRTMDDLSRVAKMLSMSGYFNDAKDVAQCGVKVLAGAELGFGAFASMTGIHIIKGKPSLGAGLMASAVKRHPNYNYKILEHTDQVCRIAFFEKWDGKFEQIGVSEMTIKDAQTAGLLQGNSNWKNYPKNMLFARAMSNGVRWYCPDVFDTPVYTPDELGAEVMDDDRFIEAVVVQPSQDLAASPTTPSAKQATYLTEQVNELIKYGKGNGLTVAQIKEMCRLNNLPDNASGYTDQAQVTTLGVVIEDAIAMADRNNQLVDGEDLSEE